MLKYLIVFLLIATPAMAITDAEYDALNIRLLRTQLELIKTQEAVLQKQREIDASAVEATIAETVIPVIERQIISNSITMDGTF
jgi:hypothetical protein